MDIYKIEELIEIYYSEKKQGKNYSNIRKELQNKNINSDAISYIIKKIDNMILEDEQIKLKKQKAWEIIGAGIVFSIAGLGITIGSFTGVINTSNSILIVYGPVFSGLSVLYFGIKKLQNTYHKH